MTCVNTTNPHFTGSCVSSCLRLLDDEEVRRDVLIIELHRCSWLNFTMF